jgi:two-component system chemotaxis response regulator CheY
MNAHILIVDDAATVRMYHRKILRDAGWQVEQAANGVEALERVLQRGTEPACEPPFDLFVVDVNMPKMDGHAFVRQLRQLDRVPQMPVLMVSTESRPQESAAAQQAGANGYIVKPARPADLVLSAALLLGDAEAAQRAAAAQASKPSTGDRT